MNPKSKAFEITELEVCNSVDAMRKAEEKWIDQLDTRAPKGYNLMRGGASVGGPSNAKPVEVLIDGGRQTFSSMAEVCRVFCTDVHEDRYYSRAMARLKAGWTIEQALGLQARVDGRTTALSAQARASGDNLASLRSARQRKKLAAAAPAPGSYQLPDPDNPGTTLSARAFAKKTGLPVTTIRHRAQNIKRQAITDPAAVIEALKNGFDRAAYHDIILDDQTTLNGSIRQVARLASKGAHLSGTLSVDAIRSRLSKLTGKSSRDELLVAIGHAAPALPASLSTAPPVLRPVHCDDWTVVYHGRTHRYANQMAFCRACYAAMQKMGITPDHPKTLDLVDPDKGTRQLQRWVSAQTAGRSNMAPTAIANALNVLEHIVPPAGNQ